jgi:hypothetical protein
MDKEIVVNTNNAPPAMQLFIPISSVDPNNVYFTEKRKNVILDGNFVKIIYSTEHFEMNGLHLLLQIYSVANYRAPSLLSLDEQLRALKTALPDSSRTLMPENNSSSCNTGSDKTLTYEDLKATSSAPLRLAFRESSTACAVNPRPPTPRVGVLADAQRLGRSDSASRFVASLGETFNSEANDERTNFPHTLSSRICEPPVKFIENFDPNLTKNSKQIELLCDIERIIVTNYIEMKAPLKTAAYHLKHQLESGYFRFARECPASQNNSKMNCFETPGLSCSIYALKISGIWETTTSVGITVKFVKL